MALTPEQEKKVEAYVLIATGALWRKFQEVDEWFREEFPGLQPSTGIGAAIGTLDMGVSDAGGQYWFASLNRGKPVLSNRSGPGGRWGELIHTRITPEILEAAEAVVP